jgi:hypothetical protein
MSRNSKKRLDETRRQHAMRAALNNLGEALGSVSHDDGLPNYKARYIHFTNKQT